MSTKVAQRTGLVSSDQNLDIHIDSDRPSSSNLPSTFMVIGIFAALFTGFSIGNLTLLSTVDLFRLLFFLCFVGLLVPHRFTRKRMRMEHLEWFFFNTFAIGPILFSTILILNFLWHGETEYRDYPLQIGSAHDGERLALLTDGWIEYSSSVSFLFPTDAENGSMVRIGKANGVFGMDVIVSKVRVHPHTPMPTD